MDVIYLPTVVLRNGMHRGVSVLLFEFRYNTAVMGAIKGLGGVRWSATMRCWYMDYVLDGVRLVTDVLGGVAEVDATAVVPIGNLPVQTIAKEVRVLTEVQRGILNGFYRYLVGKRYSDSTVKTYAYLVADFVAFHGDRAVVELTNRDVELFIEGVLLKKRYSVSTQRQFVSALKLFVVFYPVAGIHGLKLERPHASKVLPKVLAQEEVIRLLVSAKNLKHRAILAMIYSSGLRISELLNLELCDIYVERKQVLVKNSKGRKDRYVVLADGIVGVMNTYLMAYVPKRWFVEGPNGGRYSAGSVRKFLKRYCKLANINRNVTPHMLRHSYATHLLEQGVNLRYIQELLGHSKPETTMIYTHVARKDLIEIRSPLDTALDGLKRHGKGAQKVIISGGNIG